MTFVLATLVYPVVLALLCTGGGLLVDRASGRFLPLAVLPAIGFGLLIGVSQLTTYVSLSAPATPFVLAVVALAGLWIGRVRLLQAVRGLRAQPWPALAMAGAYVIAIAPVLLAGRPSLSLYLTDTTSAIHLAGADFLLHHGRDFGALDLTNSRGVYLKYYFGSDYPSGGHTFLAGTSWLLPVRMTWAYQPYMAFALATAAGPLWVLMRRVGLTGWWAGVGALVACVPALVYAFDLVGSIKELTAMPFIVLSGVLVVDHARWLKGRWFAGIPFGLVCAAGLSAVGIAFGAWIAVAVAVLVGVLVIDFVAGVRPWKQVLTLTGAATLTAIVAAWPTVRNIAGSLRATEGIATTNDPGNLLRPLDAAQIFGVWLSDDYRGALSESVATYVVIGIMILAIVLGVGHLVRSRMGALLSWTLLLGLVWAVLTVKGTTWTDAKMLLLTSPILGLLAWAGVANLRASRRTFEALVVAAVLAGGVVASDALQYHSANLAPTARFDELASINSHFGGQGATLLPDFDEYPVYELRDMRPSEPGMAYRPESLAPVSIGYGYPVDLDAVPPASQAEFPIVVARRSPSGSRPSSAYALAWRGTYYDVWKRRPDAPTVVAHQGASGNYDAMGTVKCADLKALSRQAQAVGGRLAVATRPAVVAVPVLETSHSGGWPDNGQGGIALNTPGRLDTTITVPHTGRWNIWLNGQIGRPLAVQVDGRTVATVGEQTAGLGNYLAPVAADLVAGKHRISVTRPGGSLAAGDGAPSWLNAVVLAPVADETGTVSYVAPQDYRRLCGREVDWVEVVRP